jgi:hypothetical protein
MAGFNVDMWNRLSDALGGHDVAPEDHDAIVAAWEAHPDSITEWPEEARKLLEQIESSEATSWDDPADVPDSIATYR